MNKDCIFCSIAAGSLGTEFVYEDNLCVAFRDINPKAKTHVLIVPKDHIDSVFELEEGTTTLTGHLVYVSKLVAEKLDLKGFHLQINVGEEGGQEIFHLHLHLLSKF